jgi:hypothetical protein
MKTLKHSAIVALICGGSAAFADPSASVEFKNLKSAVAKEIHSIASDIQTILVSNAKGQYNTRDLRLAALARLHALRTTNSNTTNKIQRMLDIIDEAFPADWYVNNQKKEIDLMNKQLKDLSDLSAEITQLEDKIRAQSPKK